RPTRRAARARTSAARPGGGRDRRLERREQPPQPPRTGEHELVSHRGGPVREADRLARRPPAPPAVYARVRRDRRRVPPPRPARGRLPRLRRERGGQPPARRR